MKRYAIVRNADTRKRLEAYLPDNYRVIYEGNSEVAYDRPFFVIQGRDNAGWTLDAYVIPRLASGLIGCEEIDLSHPIMKKIEVTRWDAGGPSPDPDWEKERLQNELDHTV